jgi:hypothetical protein
MKIDLDLPQALATYLEQAAQKNNSDLTQTILDLLWHLIEIPTIQTENNSPESEQQILSLLQSWEETKDDTELEPIENIDPQTTTPPQTTINTEQRDVIALLESWLDDTDDEEDRSSTEDLLQSLNAHRFSERSLFPEAQRGITW